MRICLDRDSGRRRTRGGSRSARRAARRGAARRTSRSRSGRRRGSGCRPRAAWVMTRSAGSPVRKASWPAATRVAEIVRARAGDDPDRAHALGPGEERQRLAAGQLARRARRARRASMPSPSKRPATPIGVPLCSANGSCADAAEAGGDAARCCRPRDGRRAAGGRRRAPCRARRAAAGGAWRPASAPAARPTRRCRDARERGRRRARRPARKSSALAETPVTTVSTALGPGNLQAVGAVVAEGAGREQLVEVRQQVGKHAARTLQFRRCRRCPRSTTRARGGGKPPDEGKPACRPWQSSPSPQHHGTDDLGSRRGRPSRRRPRLRAAVPALSGAHRRLRARDGARPRPRRGHHAGGLHRGAAPDARDRPRRSPSSRGSTRSPRTPASTRSAARATRNEVSFDADDALEPADRAA